MDSLGRLSMKIWSLRKDLRAAMNATIIVLIAILVVSASSVVVLLYTNAQGSEDQSGRAVRSGDRVTVDYIGRLADGRVFDTSLWSVASDDALYPKSLFFTMRAQSSYTPLSFTVGSGSMIQGFDQGVLGMVVGQTKVIEVPPEKGYGKMNQSLLFVRQLQVEERVLVNMSMDEFGAKYGYLPEQGMLVKDPDFGWDVIVMQVNTDADRVLVINKPVVGQRYAMYGEPDSVSPTGWWAEVTEVDSSANGGEGRIIVKNLLTDSEAGRIKGYDVRKGATFYIDMVNESAGTYRMNYNGELLGKTLFFTVTLRSIS
ncbi:MAG: FKBP-type peptidyl-prolyl cis-trans isomerase [Methanomassiliicoccales archaeon]